MYPELFEIPFTHVTLKSYGLMMVIGFLAAVFLIRHLSRNITPDPQLITNAALYSLIGGVVGARLVGNLQRWYCFSKLRNLLGNFRPRSNADISKNKNTTAEVTYRR